MKYVNFLPIGLYIFGMAAMARDPAWMSYSGPVPKASQPTVNSVPYVGAPPRGGSYTGPTVKLSEPSLNSRPYVTGQARPSRDTQPEGSMVGGHYVAPSWAEQADWLLRQTR